MLPGVVRKKPTHYSFHKSRLLSVKHDLTPHLLFVTFLFANTSNSGIEPNWANRIEWSNGMDLIDHIELIESIDQIESIESNWLDRIEIQIDEIKSYRSNQLSIKLINQIDQIDRVESIQLTNRLCVCRWGCTFAGRSPPTPPAPTSNPLPPRRRKVSTPHLTPGEYMDRLSLRDNELSKRAKLSECSEGSAQRWTGLSVTGSA